MSTGPGTGPAAAAAGPARIQITDLSVTEPNVYEGMGSSKALHRVVDSYGRSGLWKEYKDDVAAAMDAVLLTELVQWPSTLAKGDRERMLPGMAHPFAVVMRGDQAAGVVMPEAPGHFSYRDRRGRSRPRTIDLLSNSRRGSRNSGSPFFEPPHRLALLGRLLMLVSELHEAGVVVGDLQPQNILISADPLQPAVMVLDCDSLWLNGRHAFGAPIDPETWRSPWMGATFTPQTDLFKLALLVTRCLQEDNRKWYPQREVLTQFMPTHQVERLEGLLAKDITVTAQQLRGLAGNWRSRVGANGTLYNSTDQFLHAPWTPPLESDPPWGTAPMPAQPPGLQHSGPQHSGPQHSGPQPSGPQYSGPQYSGPYLTSNPPVSSPPGGSAGAGYPAYPGGPPANYPTAPPPRVPGSPPVEPIVTPSYAGPPSYPPPPPGSPYGPAGQARSARAERWRRLAPQLLAWFVFTAIAAAIVAAAVFGQ